MREQVDLHSDILSLDVPHDPEPREGWGSNGAGTSFMSSENGTPVASTPTPNIKLKFKNPGAAINMASAGGTGEGSKASSSVQSPESD